MLDTAFQYHFSDEDEKEAAFYKERLEQVVKALSTLTPAQREVIELRFMYGLTIQQIAGRKNTSLRTIYNLMHVGVTKLKSEIGLVVLLLIWK